MGKKKETSVDNTIQLFQILRGFLGIICALTLLLSMVSYSEHSAKTNCLGLIGHVIAWGLYYLFGLSAYLLPIGIGWLGIKHLLHRPFIHQKWKICLFGVMGFSLSILLSMLAAINPGFAAFFERWIHSDYLPGSSGASASSFMQYYLGGVPFYHLYCDLEPYHFSLLVGKVGSFLLFGSLFTVSLALLIPAPLRFLGVKLKEIWAQGRERIHERKKQRSVEAIPPKSESRPFNREEEAEKEPALARQHPLTTFSSPAAIKKTERKEEKKEDKTHSPTLPPPKEMAGYVLPAPSLLTQVKKTDISSLKNDLKRLASVLEETLLSFGIEAKVGDIHCGPTITSFEVHPAVGVKVQKIKTLENDLALNMQAKSIRIIAPIPGKAVVGIEIPNPQPQEVGFRKLIENYQASGKKVHIPLLLGEAVNGDDVWSDLTKMPHCIIAGATGSGKSVCINTIVMSILMNARPDEIKLVMVDPKKVELTGYSRLPHMLAPVITEPGEAHSALLWLVKEMEKRYEIFRQVGIRNISSFNTRAPNLEFEKTLEIEIPERLSYIVVIVDELADLMMVSSSDIETPIARIAQMARAVGIHMILATQRPSREVITGLIKANFPTRIAFKVANRVNSQIVIDENGAESLLGNGDMLFMPPGTSSLMRAQGAFIRDEDINRVIDFICAQAPTHYLIPSFQNFRDEQEERETEKESGNGSDPLYNEAKALVLETGTASTTFLQRKLKIGYARAASLMDELEKNGIIGPQEGAKPRKIFYPSSKQPLNDESDLD